MLRLYSDLRRILVLTENLLFLAGRSLQRRAMRNGVLISLWMSSTIVKTNYLTAQTLTTDQLTTLLVGAFASYPAGAVLVRLANFLSRDKRHTAAGGYLHLTSHYKQSRIDIHLHHLWHEVFCHDPPESLVPIDTETEPSVSVAPRLPDDDQIESYGLFPTQAVVTEKQQQRYTRFLSSAHNALRSPQPMGVQAARTGIHLGPIEDWYEKGFFAYEDFPAKSFSRDPLIKRMNRMVEHPYRHKLREILAAETAPSFWYAFTVRKYTSLLGKSISQLNARAEAVGCPDYFDAQHFLWPSPELDAEVERRFQGSDDRLDGQLKLMRTALMRNVFSDDNKTARRHVLRMFARDYAMIFRVRIRFDAAWAAGRFSGSPLEEHDVMAREFSLTPVKKQLIESIGNHATTRLADLDRLIETIAPAFLESSTFPLLQVAAYTNYAHFTDNYMGANKNRLEQLIHSGDDLRRHLGLLSELLHRVRIYHALIKIQVLDYLNIVNRIGNLKH
ncbi:MAG: hypothetical protein DHS20C01_07340 [marine bacterium B5-7]|nr:MAG: hypothetical protein DHS20C01_07340 [marine bacterium B5-7]